MHAHIAESLDGEHDLVALVIANEERPLPLTGIQTLRSYDQVDRSIEETNRLLDLQNRASFLSATSQRWLSVRIDFCGAVLVFAVRWRLLTLFAPFVLSYTPGCTVRCPGCGRD